MSVRQDRNFKFLSGTEIRRDGGAAAEPQSLASVPKTLELNLKSLRDVCAMNR